MVALRTTAGETVTDEVTVELVITNPFCVTESHITHMNQPPETFQAVAGHCRCPYRNYLYLVSQI